MRLVHRVAVMVDPDDDTIDAVIGALSPDMLQLHGRESPERVAELLMLRDDMPRSLLACMTQVVANLRAVRNEVSADTERMAGKIHSELKFARIDDILEAGLHDTLTEFMERIFELGNRISRDFLVPLAA